MPGREAWFTIFCEGRPKAPHDREVLDAIHVSWYEDPRTGVRSAHSLSLGMGPEWLEGVRLVSAAEMADWQRSVNLNPGYNPAGAARVRHPYRCDCGVSLELRQEKMTPFILDCVAAGVSSASLLTLHRYAGN